jgi:predicted ATP-dependent Lon-type protease
LISSGKSHLFQQVSPYAHLISGGKATVARMFVNMASGQRGLVCQYDVVCFDEIAGVSFDSKDGVNIMKGYMASGEFSRGKDSIRADGGIVMVGNLDSTRPSGSAICSPPCPRRCATTPRSWIGCTPTRRDGISRSWTLASI